ncbi:unnamed protein product [Rhodiola kirilowii]
MVGIRVSILVPFIGVVFILAAIKCASAADGDGDFVSGSDRSLLQRRSQNQVAKCGEAMMRSECLLNGIKCRWCRSEALDDMCFSKLEAWRLPRQVFTCG